MRDLKTIHYSLGHSVEDTLSQTYDIREYVDGSRVGLLLGWMTKIIFKSTSKVFIRGKTLAHKALFY